MDDAVNILLVDDEKANLDALEAILETQQGYRVLRATDADRALHLLLENDVAAIVLDIKMPGVSGFELAQLIKGAKKFRQIPIVFLTAYMLDDQDVLAGYGAGAVDYLTKPVNPQIFRHKIAVFADLFRKTRALAELNEHLEARVQERTSELEKSEAALRAASHQKDAFLATLAHELRNPLAPVRTGLHLLLETPVQSPVAARTLAAMNRQVDHMVRLIDDLLDVSRISRGMVSLQKSEVELGTVVEGAIETLAPFLDKRKQTVSVSSKQRLSAFVDATRVGQIVGNLIHNASKYSPVGAEIVVELVNEDGRGLIRVVDHGAGIPADQLTHVFDMFAKIERSTPNSDGGLGVGLALSRLLAELHGGTLEVSSGGEGLGATFTVTLPDVRVHKQSPSPVAAVDAEAAVQPGLNLVIVEDNEDAADIMAIWLEELGHVVRIARNGPDGLALILEARPQAVLCDLGLPGMDGYQVCENVVAKMTPRPVMIALTGWGMDSDRRRTRDAGFDHHLVKPVALEKLDELLKGVRDSLHTAAAGQVSPSRPPSAIGP